MRVRRLAVNALAVLTCVAVARADTGTGTRLSLPQLAAQPGATVEVAVVLDNRADPVRGLQFTLASPSGNLTLRRVRPAARAAGLSADGNQLPDGSIRVVVLSLGTGAIAPGSGPVITLELNVDTAAADNTVPLEPTDVRIAGTSGALAATTESGSLHVGAASVANTSSGGCAVGNADGRSFPLLLAGAAFLLLRARRATGVTTR